MATEKTLHTRIQLKYDTLANWNASTLELKKGEIALVEVPTAEGSTLQPVMFKVGVGGKKFSELDWASAKAADVYGWAKKPQAEFETYVKGLVDTVNLSNYYTEDEVDALLKAITDAAGLLAGRVSTLEGKYDVDKKLSVVISELEDKIADVGTGVMSVSGKDAIVATGDDAVEVSLALDNSGNVVLSQSASGLKASIDLGNYATKDEIRTDDEIKSIAATEIGRLIDVAGDDETLKNIGALVDYVENNAADIAELVTSVGTANTNASNAVTTAGEAKTAAEGAATVAGEAKELAQDAMEAASDAKTGAAASAAAAAASATEASGYATTAGEKADAASDSADAAAGSAQAAAASAVTAGEKAVAAEGSASAAAASETAAAGSATAAAGSASTASTKAGEAATSAAQAATSETNAGKSATAAAGSADAASKSASDAAAAQAAAEKAKADANTILGQVTDAATGAQATANEAKTLAGEAKTTAGEAKTTANSAVQTANAAKAVADTAVQSVAGGEGLKATRDGNAVTVGFDDDYVFVFDCGNASDKLYD